jgi:hypothetical protein
MPDATAQQQQQQQAFTAPHAIGASSDGMEVPMTHDLSLRWQQQQNSSRMTSAKEGMRAVGSQTPSLFQWFTAPPQ